MSTIDYAKAREVMVEQQIRPWDVLDPRVLDVLEIGTGSGFLAACLGRLAREVVSIERRADLADAARANLAAEGVGNVNVITADAFSWENSRRFAAICVTGAVAAIPTRFIEWLQPDGRMFIVRGRSPAMEAVLVRNASGSPRIESVFETDLPYLAGAAPAPTFEL